MNEPLHPSTLGEILDRTVHLYRSRFLVFLGIAAIPSVVLLLCAAGLFAFFAWAGATTAKPEIVGIFAVAAVAAALLVGLPLYVGASALGSAAINLAVVRAFEDQTITIRQALKDTWRRGWSYIGLFLLQALIVWVAPLAVWIGLVALSAYAAILAQDAGMGRTTLGVFFGLLAVLIVVALVGYCIWMFLRLSLAFPASVVERISPTVALKRSSSLSQGTRGRIFVLYLLGTALNYILSLLITVPAIIVLELIPGVNRPEHVQTTGMFIIFILYSAGFAIQAFTRPVYGIALMLFYYDQRIRKEGYDIELMMRQAGLVPPTPPQPEAAPWLPPIPLHAPQPETVAPPEVAELQPSTAPAAPSEESL